MVEQLDWANPTPEAWETEVAGAILRHPGCILVGHSLGAVTAARILTGLNINSDATAPVTTAGRYNAR